MHGEDELRARLRRIDRRGYKAYGEIRGEWEFGDLVLCVDHVQGDPFAAPSRLRVRVAGAEAALPETLRATRLRRVALCDRLAREFAARIARHGAPRHGSGRSGLVAIDAGGQEVLERTAVALAGDTVEARLAVGLPAAGRSVLGREAERLLCDELPALARAALCWSALDAAEVEGFVACVEAQEELRARLASLGLIAFVAEGSRLPRASGASDRPLERGAVPLAIPEALAVEVELTAPRDPRDPASRRLRGLGLRPGVTLVVGGGYHGKSTLLRALERGVHPHVPGDGREWVVSDPCAVKVRAEDGRRVEAVDISGFIGELPGGRSTRCFRSDDASGSTSQAAGIVEALEAGARVLLLDEDTSATNFMVRDARMQALVAKAHEPITPFVDRVRELYDEFGVSSVLVMGGCGDYFDVADTVLEMRDYAARDASAEARSVARELPTARRREARAPLTVPAARRPDPASLDPAHGRRAARIEARGRETLLFGRETLDLRCVEQLLDASQTRAIGHALRLFRESLLTGGADLAAALDRLEARLESDGLEALSPHRPGAHPGDLARPRRFEVAAALSRLRVLRAEPGAQDAEESSSSIMRLKTS